MITTAAPVLWYLNRGTGVVLLVLFTLVVLLGLVATGRRGRSPRWIPRFLAQGLHRNLALISTLLLVGHVASAVMDDYVDIAWRDAVVPFGAAYQPLYLAAAALSLDLLLAVGLTSVLRHRLSDRVWRRLHLLAYPSWAAALWHTIGIGTDMSTPWLRWIVIGCCVAVTMGVLLRMAQRQVAVASS